MLEKPSFRLWGSSQIGAVVTVEKVVPHLIHSFRAPAGSRSQNRTNKGRTKNLTYQNG